MTFGFEFVTAVKIQIVGLRIKISCSVVGGYVIPPAVTLKQDRQCTCNAILSRVRVTIFCRGKERSITYSECVSVALFLKQGDKHLFYRQVVTVNCYF